MPLARDNADRLCTACQSRRRRDRAPQVPAEFWHTDVMGDALASGDLGRVIRAYRSHPYHGHPLSQTVMAGWLHVSQASLSRIELGKCRLTVDDIAGFAETLGLTVALRWSPQNEAREDVDPISRRSLFGAGVGAAVGLSATTAPAAAREIDPELVTHWLNLLRVLESHDATFGPHAVCDTARREINVIAAHRQVARGVLRTDLLRVEARWAEFASWLGRDAGDERIADYWADRARRLAEESGYPDMVSYVLVLRSRWAANDLDARRAMAFAEAARDTPGTSDHVRALCALQQARGHALARDADACERSLAVTREILGRASSAEVTDLAGQEMSAPYVLAAEARCALALRPRTAISMFEDVLRGWPVERTRSRGVHQAHLALACAAADEPERAAAEGVTALRIAQTTRSDITMRKLKRLDRQLAAYELPAVADFREAVAAL